ncbi:MAG: hypothetical protein KDK91_10660 [Gammaproteobacteria bacterium]|nr:hypothetical protein [Gammaproteobacteria bacterium]
MKRFIATCLATIATLVLLAGGALAAQPGTDSDVEAQFAAALSDYDIAIQSKDPRHPGFEKALAAWRPLVESGHLGALYHVGLFHYLGVGGAVIDPALGIGMIRKSAESGYATAQAFMGLLSDKGDGTAVLRSEENALRWYQQAAAQNQCAAVKWMINAYSSGYPGLDPSMARLESLRKGLPDCKRR